jgi:hypothetical protein
MRVELAPSYRTWMLALLPTTLGVGTAALWLRSLSWPLSIDADGLTLRYHRKLRWSSMRKIGVSRSYLDGHVGEIRIHHRGGVRRIPLRGLRDGERIAEMIITLFKQTRRGDAGDAPTTGGPDITRFAGDDRLPIQDVRFAHHPSARGTFKTAKKAEMEIANVAPKPPDDCSRDGRAGHIPKRAVG